MIIEQNGLFVTVEPGEAIDILDSLQCVCGHNILFHGASLHIDTSYRFYYTTSQCLICGIEEEEFKCHQFRVNEADDENH